ncbi:GNAT family N-acetyltransferase [Bacillus pseudomycoides]|uniref:GNAT family N-acetyltransferase n=1 Tax=Bacillus pseudomycoides TaxID=64104 RepID=A0AA91V8W7_9BACI|nr:MULTISPECIES: GNAT family N-acetyltransferase [Bacillus]PEB51551.1 GNAT family N-acetyltransferase [Bacillus sp. AFS098217]PED80732.1 GNAT family N-acetyltransferase [Bacillus pseudomycoides]PEU07360.1 GNAT family N-acetyltransferase [Bacillus sp. AFS019443]PEU18266.1 GNAT family N-acetyltransferase [Bacillus sp. AFS014408]PFW60657.1 GNAT family N-acetyltransferase [Bacillus sp. AFS075034]
MNTVTYRSLVKEDYEAVKTLIGEAFGFNELIKDKKFLDSVLNIYLQGCILESSFSKVAEKDNRIIGVILGDSKKDKNRLKKAHNTLSLAYSMLKVLIANKENKKFIKEFSKVQDAYKELIKEKEDDFQGCIQLFIVSGESRGLGVGKALMNHLYNYMKSMDVESLYLYTDNRCNYGFYDSQNFKRINEKEICFNSMKDKLNIFLYCYDF